MRVASRVRRVEIFIMAFPWRRIVAASFVFAVAHCGDSTAPKTVTVTVTTDQQYILPGQSIDEW